MMPLSEFKCLALKQTHVDFENICTADMFPFVEFAPETCANVYQMQNLII